MVIGVIPARYASTRFPGKPLVDLDGKSMIQRVYEQVLKSKLLDKVIVATDDQRIFDEVINFKGNVVMTRSDHPSGTDRCNEVVSNLDGVKVVINIQGDEPLIDPLEIDHLISMFDSENVQIGTLIKEIPIGKLINPNMVKVVKDIHGRALYFSRSVIPFQRNKNPNQSYFQHIGLYGFRKETLSDLCVLSESNLESSEGLEQLRWLENGFEIYTKESQFQSIAIDTPEDVEKVLARIKLS